MARTLSVRKELLLVRVVLKTWFQLPVLHQRMIVPLVRIFSCPGLSDRVVSNVYLEPATPTEIHRIIIGLKNKATLDSKIEPLKIASTCQKFVCTFATVVNTSFAEGTFPKALKTAKVTPIHEGGFKRRSKL